MRPCPRVSILLTAGMGLEISTAVSGCGGGLVAGGQTYGLPCGYGRGTPGGIRGERQSVAGFRRAEGLCAKNGRLPLEIAKEINCGIHRIGLFTLASISFHWAPGSCDDDHTSNQPFP